eukprot:780493-Ditylum_brightwellii.AAC.1
MDPANIPVGACISALYISVTNSILYIWAFFKDNGVDDAGGFLSLVVTSWSSYRINDGWRDSIGLVGIGSLVLTGGPSVGSLQTALVNSFTALATLSAGVTVGTFAPWCLNLMILMWMYHFVPGGAIGVALKWKVPCIASCADSA